MLNCDNELGVCMTSESKTSSQKELQTSAPTLFYIGDPMCSWCYGMSNILKEVEDYCFKNNIRFEIILAGLRAGGGDYWNKEFKAFLKEEWTKISKICSKNFSFDLLELDYFNYDTGPACKAVFIVKELKKDSKFVLEFFSLVQEKFYSRSKNPKELEFYREICEKLDLSFEDFSKLFNDNNITKNLQEEFIYSRTFSRSMPSLVFVKDNQKINISIGYGRYEDVISRLNKLMK